MARIALTGHTAGLGKAIYEKWPGLGFSRTNGYDISNAYDRVRIIKAIDYEVDVFVNNAYSGFAQVDLLYELFDVWQDQPKLIINVSSNSGDGIKSKIHPYAVHKTALDKAGEQLAYLGKKCKVATVRPGWIDTQRAQGWTGKKIQPTQLLQVFDLIIKSWEDDLFFFPTVTVLP